MRSDINVYWKGLSPRSLRATRTSSKLHSQGGSYLPPLHTGPQWGESSVSLIGCRPIIFQDPVQASPLMRSFLMPLLSPPVLETQQYPKEPSALAPHPYLALHVFPWLSHSFKPWAPPKQGPYLSQLCILSAQHRVCHVVGTQ